MSKRPLPTKERLGTDLTDVEFLFVVEYVKDMNQRRACRAAGIRGEDRETILERDNIRTAITTLLNQRLDVSLVDTDWLIREFMDNHMLARQDGKISASNQALIAIGKLNTVDAFAAEKVQVHNASDVVERLQRGRQRQDQRDKPNFY